MATVAFFHAHPDDEAIATGGTMALLSDAGHEVVLIAATRGELGEPNEGVLDEGEQLGDRREAELKHAAEILGVSALHFLGYRDSGMVGEPGNDDARCFWRADVDEAADRLVELINRHNVDVLVGYDPNGTYGHPDHIQVHRVGAVAATRAGVERVFWATANRDLIQQAMDDGAFDDDGEEDERVDRASMGMPLNEITHAVDVSAAIDRKRAALAAHASQIDGQSFFLSMDDEQFSMAFGTEWYVDAAAHSRSARREGDLAVSLLS